MNILRQGFRKLSSDRETGWQTDTTEIMYHGTPLHGWSTVAWVRHRQSSPRRQNEQSRSSIVKETCVKRSQCDSDYRGSVLNDFCYAALVPRATRRDVACPRRTTIRRDIRRRDGTGRWPTYCPDCGSHRGGSCEMSSELYYNCTIYTNVVTVVGDYWQCNRAKYTFPPAGHVKHHYRR